jgi:hypothetical protein
MRPLSLRAFWLHALNATSLRGEALNDPSHNKNNEPNDRPAGNYCREIKTEKTEKNWNSR